MGGYGRPGQMTGGGYCSLLAVCILLSPIGLLTGCGIFTPPPVVMTQQTPCSTLVPDAWKLGVAGVPLPGLDASVGEVFAALDGQTGRLDQANGRTSDAITIVERCEARDAQAVRKSTRRWWQIF